MWKKNREQKNVNKGYDNPYLTGTCVSVCKKKKLFID